MAKMIGPWQKDAEQERCDCGNDAFRVEGLYVGRHVKAHDPNGWNGYAFGYQSAWIGNVMTCAKCGKERRWLFGLEDGHHYGIDAHGGILSFSEDEWQDIQALYAAENL